jgi:hypothetical protein
MKDDEIVYLFSLFAKFSEIMIVTFQNSILQLI